MLYWPVPCYDLNLKSFIKSCFSVTEIVFLNEQHSSGIKSTDKPQVIMQPIENKVKDQQHLMKYFTI